MKNGILVGFTEYQKVVAYNILKKEFAKFKVALDLLELDKYAITVNDGLIDFDASKYDFCIMLVKDQYIATLFEQAGKPCFNNYKSIFCADDKFLTHLILSNAGIKMPKTMSGNTEFRYQEGEFERDRAFKDKLEKGLGYPMVAKPTYSYGGKGIYFIENRSQLNNFIRKINKNSYIFQQFVEEGSGTDIRCIAVGGKVVFSILRQNDKNFLSNISAGGRAVKFNADKKYIQAAEKAAKVLGLDYCSVDFFNTSNKEPLLCEVNANPGGIERNKRLTGISQAKKLAEYIVNKIY